MNCIDSSNSTLCSVKMYHIAPLIVLCLVLLIILVLIINSIYIIAKAGWNQRKVLKDKDVESMIL